MLTFKVRKYSIMAYTGKLYSFQITYLILYVSVYNDFVRLSLYTGG